MGATGRPVRRLGRVTEPVSPSTGWGVLHLFCKAPRGGAVDAEAVRTAVKSVEGGDYQLLTFAILGHKADFGFMLIGPDLWRLHGFQSALQAAGVELVASYVSLTEVSEYAKGMPAERLNARLYPNLPLEGMKAFCFYPMSKRRDVGQNWFTQSYEERERMMFEHGSSGRKFAGRIVQLITGSTGLDDYEWGVTLLGAHPDDIKECVYTMRYDEASAVYAEFGPFYSGMLADLDDLLPASP